MPEILRRSISLAASALRLERRAEGQPETIMGYGAVFYNSADAGTEYVMEGWFGQIKERIAPGAFDRALREDDVRALYNHNPDALLGRNIAGTLRLSVDAKGLRYEIDPPDTQCGRDVLTSLRRGDLTGSSFAFIPREVRWTEVSGENGQPDVMIREIMDLELCDVSPVTYPAYSAATAGVRSEQLSDLLAAAEARFRARNNGRAKTARLAEIELAQSL